MQDGTQLWVADAQVQRWEARPLQMGIFPPGGAPTRASEPMGSFDDGAGRRTPIDELTYRFVASRDPMHTPALAWDAANDRWFYRSQRETLGHETLRLPDGCVLSLAPLAVFDPRDGSVHPQADPGLGRGQDPRRVVLLDDGRLLSSGVGLSADRGGNDALLRAGCGGVALELATPRFIDPRIAPPEVAAPAPAPAQAPTASPSLLQLPSPQTLGNVAIGGLLVFWLWWRLRLARQARAAAAVRSSRAARAHGLALAGRAALGAGPAVGGLGAEHGLEPVARPAAAEGH